MKFCLLIILFIFSVNGYSAGCSSDGCNITNAQCGVADEIPYACYGVGACCGEANTVVSTSDGDSQCDTPRVPAGYSADDARNIYTKKPAMGE